MKKEVPGEDLAVVGEEEGGGLAEGDLNDEEVGGGSEPFWRRLGRIYIINLADIA